MKRGVGFTAAVLLLLGLISASEATPSTQPFLFGANYPNKPSDQIDNLFYETGMNCIRLDGGGYSWETEDQKKLVDQFQSHGLGVYAQLASHYPSADYFGNKGTWFVDQNGKTGVEDRRAWAISYDGNNWPQLSYATADDFFPQMEKDFTKYMNRLAEDRNIHDIVRGIILHNEPGLFWMSKRIFDFNPKTIEQFRIWLRTQHKDIDSLNACWGTSFGSFDVVDPPHGSPPFQKVAEWMDWRRFQAIVIANFMKREAQFSASVWPGVPRTTNLPGPIDNWYGYHLSDIVAYSRPMDVVGIDIYPAPWTDRFFIPFSMDMARGAAQGRPVHVLECETFSEKLWKGMSEPDRAEMLRGQLWTMIGHGAGGVFLWGFHRDDDFSLTDGQFNDRLRACRDIAHMTKMIGIENFSSPSAKVALCIDPDDFIYSNGVESKPLTVSSELTSQVHGIYAALADAHLPVDVIETTQISDHALDHYKVLVLANPSMMDADCAANLQKFVASGGTLVAVGTLAQMDRWGTPLAAVPGFGLDHLFGIACKSADAKAPHWADQSYVAHGAQTLTADFTCNSVGKGKAYLIAGSAARAALDSRDRAAFVAEIDRAVLPVDPPQIRTEMVGTEGIDISLRTDVLRNVLLIPSTLGAQGKLPVTANDVKLTMEGADFREAFGFPGTSITSGVVRSGPTKLDASLNIDQLRSSTPILLTSNFTPLLAIEALAMAKAGNELKVSVTCFNPSRQAIRGAVSLQLPDGFADTAKSHPVNVISHGDQKVECLIHVSKDEPTGRAVINATLVGPKITSVDGIPIDVQIE